MLQGCSYLLPNLPTTTSMIICNSITFNYNQCFPLTNFYPSSLPLSVQIKPSKSFSVIVSARKKNNTDDSHSSVPKPDESTGFFPEAVLLKKRTVEEDGKVLPEFEDDEERQVFESLMLDVETDMNVELMRHYEVMYLIHENHAEEVAAVNEKIQEFLREKKGRVWRLNDWGIRKLAYKIQKAKSAHYMLMNFELEAKSINDFKTLLDKDERVIRHLVIKRDEAITEDCPPPPLFSGSADDSDDEDYEDWDDEEEMDDDDDDEDGIIVIDGDDDDTDSRDDTSAYYVREPERTK
ncbi:hypothetical protein Lal_00013334 [Lupinus albus]|uniref:Putative ribosomal protein S6 n=1 Tax=Lupinus albus TaxID=3870 RepID=A0A6A4NX82_LUPAL|nr:putative ribosomal protein S6 [Lupinus albus]KAF1890739.1 hypothetical protein Lal_00013334 [Lupinus albus]